MKHSEKVNNLYSRLTQIERFQDISDDSCYIEVPEEWFIVITDVINSTEAVEQGRYKEVNIAGSLGIMAVTNELKTMDFPFLFGGDGMTFLFSPEIIKRVLRVLSETCVLVKRIYNLDLRLGCVRISDISKKLPPLKMAKYRVSARYSQVLVNGEIINEAEALIKMKDSPWLIKDFPESTSVDFSGFSCRWKDIPTHKEETISFIVKMRDEDSQLSEVINTIYRIFGSDDEFHPLKKESMELLNSFKMTGSEARIHTGKKRGPAVFLEQLSIIIQLCFFRLILKLRLPIKYKNKNFSQAQMDNIISCDHRKLDGTLKMVLSCQTEARERFKAYLDEQYQKKRLYYGLHVSDRAVMTCFIHLGEGREVHFVDAAGGGFTLAASALKKQMKEF